MSESKENAKARGGRARAQSLSPEERQAIARKAARERWSGSIPVAIREGEFRIADSTKIAAAVLPDGKRVITQGTFLRAMGRSRTPKAGTGVLTTAADGLPFFLQADTLKAFISPELLLSTTPVFFRTQKGRKLVGYDAQLLPQVCDVYLKMRDSYLRDARPIPQQYEHIIVACDMLMRGLATVGIVALVDEATGYQEVRDKEALQAILDLFLRKELAAWAKTFPDEFYYRIFLLRGWEWKGMKVNRPQIVAEYTKDIVYRRLTPQLLKRLEEKNPIVDGRRKAKFFQWLTDDIGHPALAQHLYSVIGLMRISKTWDQFMANLDMAHPRVGDTMMLPFMKDDPFPPCEPIELRSLSSQSPDVSSCSEVQSAPALPLDGPDDQEEPPPDSSLVPVA